MHGVEVDLARLTECAVEARSPDDLPDVGETAAASGVADAGRVVAAVQDDLYGLLADAR